MYGQDVGKSVSKKTSKNYSAELYIYDMNKSLVFVQCAM